jgi:hypothetical protein
MKRFVILPWIELTIVRFDKSSYEKYQFNREKLVESVGYSNLEYENINDVVPCVREKCTVNIADITRCIQSSKPDTKGEPLTCTVFFQDGAVFEVMESMAIINKAKEEYLLASDGMMSYEDITSPLLIIKELNTEESK